MNQDGAFAAALICASPRAYATQIVERQVKIQPEAEQEYGASLLDLVADTEVRLGYLAEALATDRPALLHTQLSWLKVLCASRGVPLRLIRTNLECMAEALRELLPPENRKRAGEILDGALEHFDTAPTEVQSHLEAEAPHVDLARRFLLAVLETREADATRMILDAFDAGVSFRELHQHVLGKVQSEIGRMWQMAEVTVAEEHYCTGIVTTAATLLAARAPRPAPNGKTVLTAAVGNELHDLGIRLVSQDFEMSGWKVIALGANTPTGAVTDAVRDFGCDLIALSASMTLHVRRTAEAIQSIKAHPDCEGIPILVGGRPFTVVEDLWEVVGADGCARDAAEASQVGARLVGG